MGITADSSSGQRFLEWSTLSNLTGSQLLFFLGQQLDKDAPLYNMALAFRIRGRLDTDRFKSAFVLCVEQSDALRTVFEYEDGVPYQKVLPVLEYGVELIDLAGVADPAREAVEWMVQRSRRLLSLDRCLFDSVLLRLGEEDWIWFFNQHHLTTDASSAALVFRRVGSIYGRLRCGEPAPLPPPAFAGYLARERACRLGSDAATGSLAHAVEQSFSISPPPLYYRTRQVASTATVRVTRRLDVTATSALRETACSRELRALTPHFSQFNLIAAVLFAWQFRVSGQKRLVIGTPSHNRRTEELKETIGPLIEMLPLQVELGEGETFQSLVRLVHNAAGRMLREARPGGCHPDSLRGASVVLNYITTGFGDFDGLPVETDWVHCGHGDRGHLLRLQVHDFDSTGELVLHFDFNSSAFDEPQREAAIEHFMKLLTACTAAPSTVVESVDLISAAERRHLINQVNATRMELPDAGSVLDLFRSWVESHPDVRAVSCGDHQLTYRQLDDLSSGVAACLREKGVRPGDFVGLHLERNERIPVAILGVLKSGAAFLPIDTALPSTRKKFIVEDSRARVILCDGEAGLDPDLPRVDLVRAMQAGSQAPGPMVHPDGNMVAYAIYTSGSTGQPKGVVVEHASLLNYAVWAGRSYLKSQRDCFPLFTPLSFDLTLTSIFVPLISGGEIIVFGGDNQTGNYGLLEALDHPGVTIVKLTPAHLELLVDRDVSQSSVHTLILGGEDLKVARARRVHAAFGGRARVFNEYGPTEATVGCMIHLFDPAADTGTSVPIGLPAGNASILVLDDSGNLVPHGVVGELCIGGQGLARGYLGRPDLTETRFVPHPFEPGQRIYRSGDLARWNDRQQLEYIGRRDAQIKFKGVRVESGEVEAALLTHPAIDAAAVQLVTLPVPEPAGLQHCIDCGLPSNYPGASFDGQGRCHLCRGFSTYQARVADYFLPMDELRQLIGDTAVSPGGYDCMMLLSGGKDSTYALCQLVDMGCKVYGFTLDNGYISEQAKSNIARVVQALGIDHCFATTPAMNAIFADSLQRFSNVCNGCFKTVYTLAVKKADEMGIPLIVTGLSRGQFFETRLTEELFRPGHDIQDIDRTILDARKAYHRSQDAVYRLLDGSCFEDDALFERVRFVDFYRYCSDSLEEMLDYLGRRVPWVRPTDTGRSSNCLINDAGIFIHKRERGFHNYAFPYSWDVRVGHKERESALAELDDAIDEPAVRRMLSQVGYNPDEKSSDPQLVAYYVAGRNLSQSELRSHLLGCLPANLIPGVFVRLEQMPLTANGKLNREALPKLPVLSSTPAEAFVEPGTREQQVLADIWARVLRLDRVGIHDNFFDLGGDSILAIRIVSLAGEAGLQLSPAALFQHQTVEALAMAASSGSKTAAPPPPKGPEKKPMIGQLDETRRNQLLNALKKLS
ncbi:MAG: amino acid adenylation domain-containing protein [Limisphaerales bacterium]